MNRKLFILVLLCSLVLSVNAHTTLIPGGTVCPTSLNIANETYVLQGSIYNTTATGGTCMDITADNITLDCGGYSIGSNDNSNPTTGINILRAVSETTNITVKNCTVSNFSYDIIIKKAHLNNITNVTLYTGHNIAYAMQLYSSNSNNITNIIANGIGVGTAGLEIFGNYNNISNVTTSGFATGFQVDNAQNNQVRNVVSTGNGYGIRVYSRYNSFFNINASNNNGDGINVQTGNNNFFNITTSNNINGMYISNGDTTNLYNITASNNNGAGIYLEGSPHSNLYNITANGNSGSGIDISSASSTLNVFNIIANNNAYGIYIWSSYFDNFTNITLNGNTYGVYLLSDSNTFNNVTARNNNHAIYILGAATITNSVLEANGEGIYLREGGSQSTIYNNFFNQTTNVNFDTSIPNVNVWNTAKQLGARIYGSGQYIGGNYWTNPSGTGYSDLCTDANQDGICDNPYTLNPVTDIDYLPLSANNTIILTCMNLTQPGASYALNADILTSADVCINITADNVKFDCKGHSITYTIPSYAYTGKAGIQIKRDSEEATNVTIKNCVVSSFGYNIYIINADLNTVTNSTIYSCTTSCVSNGLALSDSNANNIKNINVTNVIDSDDIQMVGNNNNITDSTLTGGYNGVNIQGTGNMIKNMLITGSGYGIRMYSANSNTFVNLTILNISEGMIISYSSSNNITSSVIQTKSYGTALYMTSNVGQTGPNIFYNNVFNSTINFNFVYGVYLNYWNVANQSGLNIWNSSLGYIGGNIWTNPSGTGYSDTCADSNRDGYCDIPYTLSSTGPNIDYLPLVATRPPLFVTPVSPLTGSPIIGRTVMYYYNVTWTSSTPPVNCSVFDNRTGASTYAKSNGTDPLINNSVTNNIVFTYPQDYDQLTWYVSCCYPGICYSSFPQTIAVHTSQINTSASPVDQYCLNAPVYFYCNYTDGNGKPVQAALVNITVLNATSTYLYTNDPNVIANPPPGVTVSPPPYPGVLYNSTLQEFYYVTSSLPLGKYNYSCSALNVSYPFNQSGSYNYTITDLLDSKLTVTTSPDYLMSQPNGQTFYFNGSYTTQSGGLLDSADCKLIINGATGGIIIQAYYNSNVNPPVYQANTTSLMIGPNQCNFTCTQTCYRTASNLTTFIVTYGGLSSSPALIFEDPVYSLETYSTAHKVIIQSPYSGSLVSNISTSRSGLNWTYGMVVKFNKPDCSTLSSLDQSKILLVNDSSNIYDTSLCTTVNSFAGVIFEDNQCGTHSACQLTVPYAYNFPSRVYNKISNSSYVLLNGDDLVVQDISELRSFYFNGYYLASNYAPSFLMRLSGQLTPSPYGIESFVNINVFSAKKSSVDYYYFSPSLISGYKIKGMPNCENSTICSNDNLPHFYLDNLQAVVNSSGVYRHLDVYGANSLAINQTGPVCSSCNDPSCPCQNPMQCDPLNGVCYTPACTYDTDCEGTMLCPNPYCNEFQCINHGQYNAFCSCAC